MTLVQGVECVVQIVAHLKLSDHILVNCSWSDWTWGNCSAPCGGGTQNGTRRVTQPAQHGGSECTGLSTATQSCNSEECPGARIKGRIQGLPDAKIVLLGEEYDGSSDKWMDPDSGIECALGSTTTYDNSTRSFHIDYDRSSLITCPYNLSPSKQHDLTIEIIFKLDDDFDSGSTKGWIVGHDNHGFDRSLILSDSRFSGVGSGIGGTYQSGLTTPGNGFWHHGIATFRQGVDKGSFVAIDGIIGAKVKASNSDGRPEFTIGGLAGWSNHGIKGLIRAVFIYETGMDEETAKLAYRDSLENLHLLPPIAKAV